MIQKIIQRLLKSTHFWRDVGFDELSELYISMMFRSLALSLVGIFVPVFLLQTGYRLQDIALFFTLFFLGRVLWDIVAGHIIARIGPKHAMVISYIAQIAASYTFLTLPTLAWPLVVPAMLWGLANSLFYVAFHVDFSKVKHSDHGGKELGHVTAVERIGGALGPVAGGLVAFFFGAQYIFLVAIILLLAGLVPLFMTGEPVRIRQKLDFRRLQLGRMKHDLVSYAAITVENNLCVVLWPVFLALFVLESAVYLTLGSLASLGVLASILAAYLIGKLVDNRQGGILLRASAIVNACIYFVRPFVSTLPFALLVNVLNEVVTVGYRIPYHKGMYDAADDFPGFRIVYITTMETFASFWKLIIWLQLLIASHMLFDRELIMAGFCIAAISSLLIMSQRYKALEYAKR